MDGPATFCLKTPMVCASPSDAIPGLERRDLAATRSGMGWRPMGTRSATHPVHTQDKPIEGIPLGPGTERGG